VSLALKLIAQEKKEKTGRLDLGNCGLTELPEELFELEWLEWLNLGEWYWDAEAQEDVQTPNKGGRNRLGQAAERLTELPQLQFLGLFNNGLTDVSFLPSLLGLTSLDLSGNKIQDLSFLESLPGLTSLYLSHNNIQDLSFLESLPGLTSLYLHHNNIQDISFLPSLPGLTSLNLSFNKIQDISFLPSLPGLTSLGLSGNKIQDASFLSSLRGLTSLDLRNNQIQDLSFLPSLPGLTSLDLSGNKIQDYSFLQALTGLRSLNLSGNKIQDYSFLQALTGLRSLNLRSNKIQDLSFLESLTGLTSLDLSRNQIQDLSFLESLTGLTSLYLSDNKIQDISFLPSLPGLTSLDLSYNQIQDLSFLESLRGLTLLQLRSNQIQDLSFLESLPGLTSLDLSYNQIQDYSFLESLPGLTSLNLSSNQIQDLSFLQSLPGLTSLDLRNNHIQDFSALLPLLQKGLALNLEDYGGSGIMLFGNPITTPPLEVVEKGREAVLLYFEQADVFGTAPLYESKVMILGQGGAGKTTLAQLLLDPTWEVKKRQDESTLGVVVHKNRPFAHQAQEGVNIQAHLWDFGGQEVQKMLHQFFITQDCLYVIVSDKRSENTNFHYWFQIIELLGPNCPVVVLENPMETKHVNEDFDLYSFRGQYQRLQISAREVNLKYINQRAQADWKAFTNELAQHLSGLEIVNREVPRVWRQIRDGLQAMKAKYITLDDYYALVEGLALPPDTRKMTREEGQQCLAYLKSLGDLTYFEDRELAHLIFLDHNWLTDGLYYILSDGEIKDSSGRFTRAQAYAKWDAKEYSEVEKGMLIQLLLKDQYDICYETPSQKDEFITPLLLPAGKPGIWPHTPSLTYQYRYPFVPHGLFSRLIVRLNARIEDEKRWKTGVWLSHTAQGQTTRAEVEYVQHPEAAFELRICGEPAGSQEMLQFIDHELENLHRDFRNLKVTRKVACVCDVCKAEVKAGNRPFYHSLDNINGRLANRKYTVECQKSHQDVSIGQILQDVYKEEAAKGTQFEAIFHTLKEMGMSINQINNTNNNQSSATSSSSSKAKAKNEVSIEIQISQVIREAGKVKEVLTKAQQKDLSNKGATAEDLEYALEDVEEFESTLQEAQQDKEQGADVSEGTKSRLEGFWNSLQEEEAPLRKALQAIRKGRDYGVGLARTYNSLATNLGLTPVPELALKALEKL